MSVYKKLNNVKLYNRNGERIDPFGGDGGNNGSSSSQNDYVQRSELAEVAFTGDYDDLADKPSDISANNIFEPINVTAFVSNNSLIFTLSHPITENSYFILDLKRLGTISVNINNGIILQYINTNYFNGTDIRLFNDDGEFIDGTDMPYIKSYIANRTLLCYLHDGRLWIKRISLKEFANGFGENQYVKQIDLNNLNNLYTPSLNNRKTITLSKESNKWLCPIINVTDGDFGILISKNPSEVTIDTIDQNGYLYYLSYYFAYNDGTGAKPLVFYSKDINNPVHLIKRIYPTGYVFDLDYLSNPFGYFIIDSLNDTSNLKLILPYGKNINTLGYQSSWAIHTGNLNITDSSGRMCDANGLSVPIQEIYINDVIVSANNPILANTYYYCYMSNSNGYTLYLR